MCTNVILLSWLNTGECFTCTYTFWMQMLVQRKAPNYLICKALFIKRFKAGGFVNGYIIQQWLKAAVSVVFWGKAPNCFAPCDGFSFQTKERSRVSVVTWRGGTGSPMTTLTAALTDHRSLFSESECTECEHGSVLKLSSYRVNL